MSQSTQNVPHLLNQTANILLRILRKEDPWFILLCGETREQDVIKRLQSPVHEVWLTQLPELMTSTSPMRPANILWLLSGFLERRALICNADRFANILCIRPLQLSQDGEHEELDLYDGFDELCLVPLALQFPNQPMLSTTLDGLQVTRKLYTLLDSLPYHFPGTCQALHHLHLLVRESAFQCSTLECTEMVIVWHQIMSILHILSTFELATEEGLVSQSVILDKLKSTSLNAHKQRLFRQAAIRSHLGCLDRFRYHNGQTESLEMEVVTDRNIYSYIHGEDEYQTLEKRLSAPMDEVLADGLDAHHALAKHLVLIEAYKLHAYVIWSHDLIRFADHAKALSETHPLWIQLYGGLFALTYRGTILSMGVPAMHAMQIYLYYTHSWEDDVEETNSSG